MDKRNIVIRHTNLVKLRPPTAAISFYCRIVSSLVVIRRLRRSGNDGVSGGQRDAAVPACLDLVRTKLVIFHRLFPLPSSTFLPTGLASVCCFPVRLLVFRWASSRFSFFGTVVSFTKQYTYSPNGFLPFRTWASMKRLFVGRINSDLTVSDLSIKWVFELIPVFVFYKLVLPHMSVLRLALVILASCMGVHVRRLTSDSSFFWIGDRSHPEDPVNSMGRSWYFRSVPPIAFDHSILAHAFRSEQFSTGSSDRFAQFEIWSVTRPSFSPIPSSRSLRRTRRLSLF